MTDDLKAFIILIIKTQGERQKIDILLLEIASRTMI